VALGADAQQPHPQVLLEPFEVRRGGRQDVRHVVDTPVLLVQPSQMLGLVEGVGPARRGLMGRWMVDGLDVAAVGELAGRSDDKCDLVADSHINTKTLRSLRRPDSSANAAEREAFAAF